MVELQQAWELQNNLRQVVLGVYNGVKQVLLRDMKKHQNVKRKMRSRESKEQSRPVHKQDQK